MHNGTDDGRYSEACMGHPAHPDRQQAGIQLAKRSKARVAAQDQHARLEPYPRGAIGAPSGHPDGAP